MASANERLLFVIFVSRFIFILFRSICLALSLCHCLGMSHIFQIGEFCGVDPTCWIYSKLRQHETSQGFCGASRSPIHLCWTIQLRSRNGNEWIHFRSITASSEGPTPSASTPRATATKTRTTTKSTIIIVSESVYNNVPSILYIGHLFVLCKCHNICCCEWCCWKWRQKWIIASEHWCTNNNGVWWVIPFYDDCARIFTLPRCNRRCIHMHT